MNEKVESGLEVATFWVLFDATAEQPFIKKDARDGTLTFFDSEHQAIRAKRTHVDTDYKRVDYVRQSDAERALSERDAEIQRQRERHRTTWTQLEQVKGLLKRIASIAEGRQQGYADRQNGNVVNVRCADALVAMLPDLRPALSQQAEPECRCTMRERTVGDGCSVCNPELAAELEGDEPAPAQDEREAFEARMRLGGYSNPEKHPDGSYVSSAMELWWQGWNAYAAWQRTRPAQTEQQPEQEPFWYAVVSEQAPSINSAIRRLDVAQEFADSKRERWPDTRVVPLYAAPQPEQSLQCVPDETCRRLLFAFGLECNSIGLQGAAENLHKGMKTATSALSATPIPAMAAKEE